MNVTELRNKLKEIFGEEVKFNPNFDDFAKVIKNIDSNLVEWCQAIKEGKIIPVKPSRLPDHLVFIKRIGSSNRCLIIKIKNDGFKEIHLGDHKYYNEITRRLGLKQSSYNY